MVFPILGWTLGWAERFGKGPASCGTLALRALKMSAGIAGKGFATFLGRGKRGLARDCESCLSRVSSIDLARGRISNGKEILWKPRWLLWLEGIGHRTCLAVQQQRFRQTTAMLTPRN